MRNALNKTQHLAIVWLCLLAGSAIADEPLFDQHPNMAPVAGLFMLNSDRIADGNGWRVNWQTASHAARERRGDSAVLFDGETSRLNLSWRQPIGARWSVSADLSYWWHTRGTLDSFIDDWHSFFGLPDGIRDDVPNRQIAFQWSEDGVPIIDITRTRHGIGDLRLRAQRLLGDEGHWALTGQVKLPIGSTGDFASSGGTDIGVNLSWLPPAREGSRWSWSAGAGMVALGDADIDLGAQERVTWVAHGELRYRASQTIRLGARVQGHGAVTDSRLDMLGTPAVWLVTGGEIQFGEHWQLHLSVSEDIKVESAPDATFNLGLHHKF